MIGLGLLLQLAASQQIITEAPACDGVFLATFNIQNYGESKASKSAVLDALAAVIVRYDVVTIQEISQMPDGTGECGENTESSICSLQVAVNAHSPRHFSLRISPRIGDEQYAILYDTTLGTYLSGDEFPDSTATFSRPPYAFHLDIGGARLAIASTHTSPSTASAEIAKYPSVLSWMEGAFAADYYMVAGDFNADGSYFDEDSEWTSIMSSLPNYTLLTGNDLDTTVSSSSNTYDRIIASSHLQASPAAVFHIEEHVNLSGVFEQGCADGYISSSICSSSPVQWFEVTKELSDHYPVELCMHLNGTCSDCAAPTALSAGDCAVVGFQADDPDDFAILLLAAVSGGQTIYVTDNGVKADGSFRDSEGVLQFTASGPLPVGGLLRRANFTTASGSFALSSSGDQLVVYTGTKDRPTFLCAINFEGTGWQSDATSAATSALPPGLDALALDETDNAVYLGNTSGSVEELRLWTRDATNWASAGLRDQITLPSAFTIVTPSTMGPTSATTSTSSMSTDISTSASTSTSTSASEAVTTVSGTSGANSTTSTADGWPVLVAAARTRWLPVWLIALASARITL